MKTLQVVYYDQYKVSVQMGCDTVDVSRERLQEYCNSQKGIDDAMKEIRGRLSGTGYTNFEDIKSVIESVQYE